ncbi:MAG TPA: hypothetical protein VLD65_12385 [Anaerolineales bacterium]|nr:hypothetical protein [Anaerolineales bacterium]
MFGLENHQLAYVLNAFLVQLILIAHFALRKWRFNLAMRYGPLVYAMSIPSFALSIFLYNRGVDYAYWLGGFIYMVWGLYGYSIEYILKIEWRNSLHWSILIPYVVLYLATVMFYWWPLALIYKPLWYVYAVFFLVSTYFNVTSHRQVEKLRPNQKFG